MELTQSDIAEYTRRYGWTFRTIDERQLQTGWFDSDRFFELDIQLSDTFVELRVTLFEGMHMEWLKSPELLCYLMGFNANIKMVRLGLDEGGAIILSCDLSRQDLTYEVWEQTLGVLGYYSSFLYRDCLRQFCHFGLPSTTLQPL